jgi:hypothetical protein
MVTSGRDALIWDVKIQDMLEIYLQTHARKLIVARKQYETAGYPKANLVALHGTFEGYMGLYVHE